VTDDLPIHAAREPGPRSGDFVLYWMRGIAMRARHNPALDFATEQANTLGLPVLVYQGLRHDYPWASDRLHTFILESAVDLYDDLAARGVQYGLYLETGAGEDRSGRQSSPLVQLANRAALVVTDFFPTFIMPRHTKGLRAKVDTPVLGDGRAAALPPPRRGRGASGRAERGAAVRSRAPEP